MTAGGEDRVRAKLQKLLALARLGVGGEKENARSMLERLLAKHGLAIEDLDDVKAPREIRWFRPIGKEEGSLLTNCVATVIGSARAGEGWRKKGSRAVGYDLTKAEFAQVELVFEIHRRAFRDLLQKQRRAALIAYLSKNNLLPNDADGARAKTATLSPADVEAILAMMANMKPTAVHRALEAPGSTQ